MNIQLDFIRMHLKYIVCKQMYCDLLHKWLNIFFVNLCFSVHNDHV